MSTHVSEGRRESAGEGEDLGERAWATAKGARIDWKSLKEKQKEVYVLLSERYREAITMQVQPSVADIQHSQSTYWFLRKVNLAPK